MHYQIGRSTDQRTDTAKDSHIRKGNQELGSRKLYRFRPMLDDRGIIPLLLKPSSISFGVRMPTHRNKTTTEKSTMPGRILSAIKAAIIPNKDNSTNTISNVI